jgi:hypothetical protein
LTLLVVRLKSVLPADTVKIRLTKGRFAFVSPNKVHLVNQYYWRAVKSSSGYYARARYQKNGKIVTIRMHRLVAGTPEGMICHHKDHNRLNNTDENLENQTPREHRHTDGWHCFEH